MVCEKYRFLRVKKGNNMNNNKDLSLFLKVELIHCAGSMPVLGYGTYRLPDNIEGERAVLLALSTGYRHIDTAAMYQNEEVVGRAIRKSGIAREEIFLTTKLWVDDHGGEKTARAFEESMNRLGLDHVDLYLSHWPVEGKRRETWKAMEKIYLSGRARAIGVSNYMVHHLDDIFEIAKIIPAVNQIELHPFNYRSRRSVIDFCRENGIVVQAYTPLTRGRKLDDPHLTELGVKYSKSSSQILIRWSLQRGFTVLPKSATPERIIENFDVFDFTIDDTDMQLIDNLDENLAVTWDPTGAP